VGCSKKDKDTVMDMYGRGFGVHATTVTVAFVAGFAVSAGIAIGAAQTTAGKTVWDGAFNAAQAGRGKAAYVAECSGCHLETLQGDGGSSPALIGKEFVEEWDKRSVRDLFSRIRNTMPATNPGGLSDQAYVDITAYLLQMNKFPEGAAELPPDADALKAVLIQQNKP
jgi:mono/diheme cytochrome c family protein